jgi:hypothetical protein
MNAETDPKTNRAESTADLRLSAEPPVQKKTLTESKVGRIKTPIQSHRPPPDPELTYANASGQSFFCLSVLDWKSKTYNKQRAKKTKKPLKLTARLDVFATPGRLAHGGPFSFREVKLSGSVEQLIAEQR